MNWFFISLGAPAIWALINHLDKFIISKYFSGKGVGSLVIFTSLSGFIAAFLIAIFKFSTIFISVNQAFLITLAGVIIVASYIPYLHALEAEEASLVVPLFQLIPVFGYFLGFVFLHEQLTVQQTFSSILIIAGAVIISLDLTQRFRFKSKTFSLMAISSFMIAVNALIFKIVALDSNFWGTAFWEYIGTAIFGVILFFGIGLYRKQFLATIEKSRIAVTGINISTELLNVVAKLLSNYATLIAPLVLVWVVNGFQPLISFVYGVIFTLFFPWIGKEILTRKVIIQKLVGIFVIFIGVVLLLK